MNQLLLVSCFSFVCKEDPLLAGKKMELTESTIKINKQTRGKIKSFILCWLGWFVFISATASFVSAVHRYLNHSSLGPATEVPLCLVFALFYTIWWFLVIKKR